MAATAMTTTAVGGFEPRASERQKKNHQENSEVFQ